MEGRFGFHMWSQHTIAKFRRSFSSGRVCRFCMSDYSNLNNLLIENDCVLRTPDAHAYHVRSVLADETLFPVYGVTGPSPFDVLQVGSTVDIFAPDLLHEILEGLVTFRVQNVIKTLHTEKIVRLKTVREATGNFKYGRHASGNKPPRISPKVSPEGNEVGGFCISKVDTLQCIHSCCRP